MPSVISAEPSSATVATMPTWNGAEAQCGQVDGEQHGDEAVAEVPEGPGSVETSGGIRATLGRAGSRRNPFRPCHGAWDLISHM